MFPSSCILYVVVKVGFKQSSYNVVERGRNKAIRRVQVGLVLSNPSSTNITIKVEDNGGTATGMYRQSSLHVIIIIANCCRK